MAHEVHTRITELTDELNYKWNNETKNYLLECEMQKLRTKHENENNALKMKMDLNTNEFNIKRKTEYQK